MFGQAYGDTNSRNNTFGDVGSTNRIMFVSNTNQNTTFSTSSQGSNFGGSLTSEFGAQSPFSSVSTPVLWAQGSPFGRNSTSVFGPSPLSSSSSTSLIQGSVFTGNSTLTLEAPPSSFSSGKGSPFGGNTTGVFGVQPSPFSSASSSSFLANGSLFGGNSRGVFRTPASFSSTSSSNFGFGVESTAARGSSMMAGFTNIKSHNQTTGPFFGKTSNGLTSSGAHALTMMAGFTNNKSLNQTTRPFFGHTSNGFGTTPANMFSTSQNTGPITWGQSKGSRIKSYKCTTIQDGTQSMKHMSISAMPTYLNKSHEELRWEDYELKSEGQQNPFSSKIQATNREPLNVLSATPKPLFPVSNMNVKIKTIPNFNLSSPNQSPNFPISKSTVDVSNSVLPQSPISPTVVALPNPQLPTQSSGPTLNFPPKSPSIGSGCAKVSPTTSLSFWKNGSVPLECPQPHPSVSPPQCSVAGNVSNISIAVKDPFGSEPVTSQPSVGCSLLVQHGIASMPVLNEPTNVKLKPSKVSSLLTSRYRTVRPWPVNVRRYRPSTDGPKVPFFEEIQYKSKSYSCVFPRENPRSVFASTSTELTVVSFDKEVLRMKQGTAVEQMDETANEDQVNSSSPNFSEGYLTETNENAKESHKLVMPKLQRPDYYTEPSIAKITSIESNNPGFCRHVKDFVVGRKGYGWVKFYGETDIHGLDLDSLIQINDQELIVYDDGCEKPPIGQALNKAAEVTLLNVKCIDKTGKEYKSGKMVEKFKEKLRKVAEKQGAEFVSYDPVEGVWKFIVHHFQAKLV